MGTGDCVVVLKDVTSYRRLESFLTVKVRFFTFFTLCVYTPMYTYIIGADVCEGLLLYRESFSTVFLPYT